MRSAISALAVLAGVAPTLAVPGRGENPWAGKAGGWSGSWGRHSRPGGYWSDAPSAPAYTAPSSSGVEVSPVIPVPSGWSVISTGTGSSSSSVPSGYWANATAPGSYQTTTVVTVTEIATSYTTVCPYESEYTSGTETLTSSGTTTSTVETTYLSTITITSTYPAGPGGYGGSPATSTPVSSSPDSPVGGSSSTPGAPSYGGSSPSSSPDSPVGGSSTAPGAPSYGGSSPSSTPDSPVGGSSSSAPGAPSYGGSSPSPSSVNAVSQVYSSAGTSDAVSPTSVAAPQTVVPVPYGSYTPSEWKHHPWGPHTTVIRTHITSKYTTVHPYETTHTSGGSTITSTGTTTSTLTSTIETTITITTTVPESSSSTAGPISDSSTSLGPVTVTPTSSSSGSGPSSYPAGGSSSAASDSSSSPVSPVTDSTSSTSLSETSYTTFETTCSESGSSTVHTHSAPITTSTAVYGNGTTSSSSVVGPIGTGSSYPGGYPSGSYSLPPYGGDNATTSSSVSGPVTGSTTSSSVSGPITGSTSSSSSETSFTTFTTTCTENGTTTLHTHSAPITTSATVSYGSNSSSTVGPIGTGSTSSSSVSSPVSGSISYSANVTSSSSESSYTTYTTTCLENSTSVIHTHSAPITTESSSTAGPITNSASATYSAGNTTTAGPTGTGSVSISSSSSSTSSSATPSHTGCVPCEGQPGNDPEKFCGYTIKDNPYKVLPKTCKTREFTFEITNTTVSPDGVERLALAVNGQVPGPLLEAYWGDNIVVHIKNSMQNNGSTIHWHGQRQNYTNEQDGVASITQCPIAPGETYTYNFTADNFGFSWYHAHYAIQAYEGVFGPMLVHGPKSVDGDYDEVPVVLNDWSHVPVDEMYDAAQTVGNNPVNGPPPANSPNGPRTMDTGLINGKNVWQNGGSRWSLDVEQGETKILHFLNAAIQSTYIFYIDGHSFQVIANDYVPIVPYTATSVVINPGQRYSILVKFDQPSSNYWLRADNQNACAATTQWNDIKAVIHYTDAAAGTPSSTAQTYTAGCYDEATTNLVPAYGLDVGAAAGAPQVETVVIGGNGGTPNLYKWTLNNVTFESEWDHPTLLSIYDDGTVPTYSGPLAVEIPNLDEWVYFIIQSPVPFPHPIHLHGHDFYVLSQGTGMYANQALNLKNPPRRDTAMMPWDPQKGTGGYLVMAFQTDNPGAWLLHCHIGWHNAMGFALQIIENQAGIKPTVNDPDTLHNTCSAYSAYASANGIETDDSGV